MELTVSDWTGIQSMMPSYLIGSEIQGKPLDHEIYIGHSHLKKNEVSRSVKLNKYPKYDDQTKHSLSILR